MTQAIRTVKSKISEEEKQLTELQREEAQKQKGIHLIAPSYVRFKSWADEFCSATLEQRKMIVCQLFKRIEVGRDYKISVELNMTYQQFCTEWDNGNFIQFAM